MKQVNIPEELEVKFTAKEIGDIRNYLSENFVHSKVSGIIVFLENRMVECSKIQPPKPSNIDDSNN